MKLVIDIQEEDYKKVQDGRASVSMMRKAIRTGTPLPKGHGRLIDADDIDNHIIGHVDTRSCPTIIEADTESEERNE